jgi:hypothetical protein
VWEANSLSMHIANNLQRSFELKQHRLRHKNFSRLVDERMDLLLLQGNLGSLDHTRKLGFQQLPLSPQTPSPTARARQRVLVHTSLSPCTSDALHPRGVRNRCCLLLYPKSAYSTTPSENVPHTTPPPPTRHRCRPRRHHSRLSTRHQKSLDLKPLFGYALPPHYFTTRLFTL